MTLDFGDDDVADLASSQDMLMYSEMIHQDIISDDEHQWQHVSFPFKSNFYSVRGLKR